MKYKITLSSPLDGSEKIHEVDAPSAEDAISICSRLNMMLPAGLILKHVEWIPKKVTYSILEKVYPTNLQPDNATEASPLTGASYEIAERNRILRLIGLVKKCLHIAPVGAGVCGVCDACIDRLIVSIKRGDEINSTHY